MMILVAFQRFQRFAEGLYEFYFSTRHPVHNELPCGLLLILLILLKRGGMTIILNSENEASFLWEMEFLERSVQESRSGMG